MHKWERRRGSGDWEYTFSGTAYELEKWIRANPFNLKGYFWIGNRLHSFTMSMIVDFPPAHCIYRPKDLDTAHGVCRLSSSATKEPK